MIAENNSIKPADLYEWSIESLESGRMSLDQEARILDNLKGTDWIAKKFETLPEESLVMLYHDLIRAIEMEDTPVDLMSLSRMYYSFSAMWLDTSKLRDLINTSEYVRKRVLTSRR